MASYPPPHRSGPPYPRPLARVAQQVTIHHPSESAALAPIGASSVRRAHMIGVGGSGMRNLARVLQNQGWSVSGSDLAPAQAGLSIASGHDAALLTADLDLVVASDAIPADHCERRRAAELGLPVLSYAELLGQLMHGRFGLAVAGTHGKSTTCAMTASILRRAGLEPTVVFGAEPVEISRAWRPKGERGVTQWVGSGPNASSLQPGTSVGHFGLMAPAVGRFLPGEPVLVEACEYRANFLHLRPSISVILEIEPDHFDYFATDEQFFLAFAQFAQKTPSDGLVLAYRHCSVTLDVTSRIAGRRETFGYSCDCDWQAVDVRSARGRYRFRVLCRGQEFCGVRLAVLGRHQVTNALAAAAMAAAAGVNRHAIARGLAGFRGLKRRLEWKSVLGRVGCFDDYAHHPTEVAAALGAVRETIPGGRLWCVFEPHQSSRTERLLEQFALSLQNADRVCVGNIFRARETRSPNGEVTARHLADRARHWGLQVEPYHQPEQIKAWLAEAIRNGDLTAGDAVVTMGAGNVGKIFHGAGQWF